MAASVGLSGEIRQMVFLHSSNRFSEEFRKERDGILQALKFDNAQKDNLAP